MFRLLRPFRLAALGLLISAFRLPPSAISAPPVLLAAGTLAADGLDREGDTVGGLGSGLAYDAANDRFLAVADRGPGDGSVDFRPRYHVLKVVRDAAEPARLVVTVEQTVVFLDPDGHPFTGLVPDELDTSEPRRRDGRRCLDPECIVLAPDGTLYVGEEYGPAIFQFKRDGTFLRRFAPPDHYVPRQRDGTRDFSDDDRGALAAGRIPNHGFEGLALSPDGRFLTALLQSPLLQDGGKKGGTTRLLVYEVATGKPVHEYPLSFETADAANARLGLKHSEKLKTKHIAASELLALPDGAFLLLERDNRGLNGTTAPEPAADKSLWRLDLTGATDLLAHPGPLPKEFTPVQHTLFLDLVAAPWRKLTGWTDLSEKWEGLALRPVPDHATHFELLVATDNDFLLPVLQLDGKDVPFPKAQSRVDTQFLLFDVTLPVGGSGGGR